MSAARKPICVEGRKMPRVTGPLFKWFGSKWLSSKTLPAPKYDVICEPFAGGAGYSLRHSERTVYLSESNEQLRDLWRWLIDFATEAEILDIPLGIPEGTDIRTIGLNYGQSLLLKHWQRTNNVGNCWTISPWGDKPGQWTASTRARVADQFGAIRHWEFVDPSDIWQRPAGPATWFVDPPYQFNYAYRLPPIDYADLAGKARSAPGQAIVCEAICPKTGTRPTWLPFQDFGSRITSRRKATNNHHSSELICEMDNL